MFNLIFIGLSLGLFAFVLFFFADGSRKCEEKQEYKGPGVGGSNPVAAGPGSSGLFTSGSVKTLLFSGSALLIFSVYLFVRSYWDFIPDYWKFASLAIVTTLIYGTGCRLWRLKTTPKTATTLLLLGLALVPFNVYAGNVLVFGRTLSADWSWFIGSVLFLPLALTTAKMIPIAPLGFLIGGSVLSAAFFGVRSWQGSEALQSAALAASTLIVLIVRVLNKSDEDIETGLMVLVHSGLLAVFAFLSFHRFFWAGPGQLETMATLIFFGASHALISRYYEPSYAYPASVSFVAATIFFVRFLGVPLYKYGYFLIPAGMASLLRAWTFERGKREELAKPYFLAGQLSLAASLIALAPAFSLSVHPGMGPLMIVLFAATAAYAAGGALYREPFYTYASGIVLLFVTWTMVWSHSLDFSFGILYFTAAACGFLLFGFAGGYADEDQIGQPLTVLGLATLSISVAMLAGRWGSQLMETGTLMSQMSPSQLDAGLWTGIMSLAAYGFLAAVKKKEGFLYPALVSATWVYICCLQKVSLPIDLLHMSGIVMAALAVHYALESLGKSESARCFALWGQMAAVFIGWGALASQSSQGTAALLLCALCFLPGLWRGSAVHAVLFLAALYTADYLWYSQLGGVLGIISWAEYALQLILVNLAVICLRTILTYARPQVSIEPFRVFGLMFSVLSLVLSLHDVNIAWQVFLVYGIVGLTVSYLHYEGRYAHIPWILILAACELFLKARHVEYIEAYTLPVAIFMLAAGRAVGTQNKGMRDFLYGMAQIMIYAPSSIQAMNETWEWHGIFLGVSSLSMMVYGIHQRSRIIVFPSFCILIGNGLLQSRQYFLTVPRWIYLGLGGITLLTLGGLFEFQREVIYKVKDRFSQTVEEWD